MMGQLWQDLRYGLRGLARSPGATLVVLLSLTLGIGANAVIFSLVNSLLFRPLPVPHPGRLLRITLARGQASAFTVSFPEYRDLASQDRSFSGMAGYNMNSVILGIGDDVREEWMEIVTPNYFSVLGIAPVLGRGFGPAVDRESAAEIVISDRLWRARFQRDPRVVGRVVKLNGHVGTVVGVAPAAFHGTFAGFDIGFWVPTGLLAEVLPGEPPLSDRSYRFLMLIGRLAPESRPERAAAELTTLMAGWPAQPGEAGAEAPRAILGPATGAHPLIQQLAKAFLALLLAVVGLVLLIACANVANLLLARGAARRRETAVRLSLGAGRLRLLRQHLTESTLLAVLGGLGGLLLAFWLSHLLVAFRPPVGIPVSLNTSLDHRVLGFTAMLALGTTIVFGLAPALQASRTNLTSALKGVVSGGGRSRLRHVLVIGQVAISTVLLIGAVLLVRSLRNSATVDPGFDSRHFLTLDPGPQRIGYDEQQTRALWDRLAARLETVPGVESVTLALFIPLGDRGDRMGVSPGEQPAQPADQVRRLNYNFVSPGYFAALRTPIVSGRAFAASDQHETAPVAIVSQALATRFWAQAAAVGQRLHVIDRANAVHGVEVVGVVQDSKFGSLGESPRPVLYLPTSQWYRQDTRVLIRTQGDPARVAPLVRAAVHEIAPDLPPDPTTMEQETAFTLVPVRLAGAVLAGAGSIALLLATIGIYGVVSYSVSRQYREIGIRMALGATRRRVGGLYLRQGVRLTVIGLVPGLVVAAAATPVLRGLLYGISPADPVSFVGIALVLAGVSVLACYVPARRAAGVEPATVLRDE